jgi:hypothetical protein
MVAFLEASYATSIACMEAHDERMTSPNADLQPFRDQTRATHDEQVQNLTRLMMLSSARVVAAAEVVHYIDHELVNTTFGSAEPHPTDFDEINVRLEPARGHFIAAARRSLHVPGTVHPTYPRRWWDVTTDQSAERRAVNSSSQEPS